MLYWSLKVSCQKITWYFPKAHSGCFCACLRKYPVVSECWESGTFRFGDHSFNWFKILIQWLLFYAHLQAEDSFFSQFVTVFGMWMFSAMGQPFVQLAEMILRGSVTSGSSFSWRMADWVWDSRNRFSVSSPQGSAPSPACCEPGRCWGLCAYRDEDSVEDSLSPPCPLATHSGVDMACKAM